MKALIISTVLIGLIFNCYGEPQEPAGKKVTLGLMDQKGISSTALAWKTKGLTEETQGRYLQALYCFQQAQKTWPAKDPNPELKLPWISAEQFIAKEKAELFLRMRQAQLALYWNGKMNTQANQTSYRNIQINALYMSGQYAEAEKYLPAGPSVMRAALLCSKNKETSGLEMLRLAWAEVSKGYVEKMQTNPTQYKNMILNLWWMEYPDQVQALIKKIDPHAPIPHPY